MATILEFRYTPRLNEAPLEPAADRPPCKIVFFPGVRVTYWDDLTEETHPKPAPTGSASRKPGKQKRR